MLTRREYVLIRPWQERRYIYHREKVKYALPAIDNISPPVRPHVSCKLKKIQKEAERCSQIVNDNFTLLQHLSNIMSTTRVDHFWEEPPPNFLHRVGMYKIRPRSQKKIKPEVSDEERPATRKERCFGCSPDRFHTVEIVPEERIPFTPPKKRVTKKIESPPDWEKQYKFRCAEDRPEFRGKIWKKTERRSSTRQMDTEKRRNRRRRKHELMEQSQCIYLSKDGLSLSVKFPSRSEVLMSNQRGTIVLERELCECKSFPKKLSRLRKSPSETLFLKSPEKLTLDTSEIDFENKTMISLSEGFNNLKIDKEAEEIKKKLTFSYDSYLFTDKKLENVKFQDSEFEIEEEKEEIILGREEAKDNIEEAKENIPLEQEDIDEEEVKQEEVVERELKQELFDKEVEQEVFEKEVVQDEIVDEDLIDQELEAYFNDSDNKFLWTNINENEVMKKVKQSEGNDSEVVNTIKNYTVMVEEEHSSSTEIKISDGDTRKVLFLKEGECAKDESIENMEVNEELLDFSGNSKQDLLIRLAKSNQLEVEEENCFINNQAKSDQNIPPDDQDKGNVKINEVGVEIIDQYVCDEGEQSMSQEDEFTEEPIAINEIGMKDTFSETENEVLLRGITFDTSQELITDELIEHNEDEEAALTEKSSRQYFSKESIEQNIKKVLEDSENIISELNEDDWLEDFNSDNIDPMINDDKFLDKELHAKSDK